MKKFILIFFIMILTQNTAVSVTAYLASIEEAILMAMEHSGEFRTTQALFGVSEAQIFTADAIINPALIMDVGLAEKTYRTGVQWIIETAGKRKKRKQEAVLQHQITQDEIDVKMLDIKTKVRNAYVDLYAARQKVENICVIVNTADKLLEIANKKFTTGTIPQSDLIQIELIKFNAEIELYNIESEVLNSYNTLNLLLGHNLHVDCVLETPVIDERFSDIVFLSKEEHEENIKKLTEIAFENRPEIKLKQDNIDLAKKQLDIAKTDRIPNILLASGPDLVSNSPGTLNVGAFIMAAVEVPIFNHNKGPIKKAKATQELSEKQLKAQQDIIIFEIRDAYNRLLLNIKLANKYRDTMIPRVETIVEQSFQSFEKDRHDIMLPLVAQEGAMKIRLAYINALADYSRALSDLERAIGIDL